MMYWPVEVHPNSAGFTRTAADCILGIRVQQHLFDFIDRYIVSIENMAVISLRFIG